MGPTEETIFEFARRIESLEMRDEYLSQACNGDADVRARVSALLQVHDSRTEFLESPPVELETLVHASSNRIGSTIGNYKLMEQIGEGGMGVVYVGEQQYPIRRRVAVKVIKPGMDSKEILARFAAERQALALMDHPNIAKVHDAGTTDSGHPYFVMELVRGIPVTEYCDLHRFSLSQRLQLFVDICHAAQHAHQKGIIHRDLKPSNVLVTEHDGSPVVKVIDFGVAKAINQQLTDQTIYTRFQQMVGTPLYMSPEQAELSGLDVDTRSDIYALGVLLFELLTGTTPFDKDRLKQAAMEEMRRIIREEEPSKPSTKIRSLGKTADTVSGFRSTDPNKLSRLLSGDLDWIIMKSLEKDRNRRYDTAKDFASDILRHVNDEPVIARPPSRSYKLKKLVRRNKAAFATGAIVLASLVIGLGLATLGWRTAQENHRIALTHQRLANDRQEEAEAAKEAAEASSEQLERQLYLHQIRNADDALKRNRLLLAGDELKNCQANQRGWEWRFLDNLHRQRISTLEATERPCFSNDGTRVTAIALSHDKNYLTTTWDFHSREVLQTYAHEKQVTFVALSPDESLLAGGDAEGHLVVWRYDTGEKLWSLQIHNERVHGVAFSPDGRKVATSSGRDNPMVQIIDIASKEVERDLGPFAARLYGVEFSPDGRWLATSTHVGPHSDTFFINVDTGEQLTLADELGTNVLPTFNPTGELLATSHGRRDGETYHPAIKLWRWNDGSPVQLTTWSSQNEFIRCLAFSSDGTKLATGSSTSRRIKIREVETGITVATHYDWGPIHQLSFHPSGNVIASYSYLTDTQPRLRFLPVGRLESGTISKPLSRDTRVRFSPNGQRLVVGTPLPMGAFQKDESLGEDTVVLDANSNAEIFRFHDLYAPSWSANGTQVVGSSPGHICGFRADTGKETFRYAVDRPDMCKASFIDKRGRRIAFFSDTEVKIWHATKNEQVLSCASFLEKQNSLTALQLSRKANRIALGLFRESVAIWDISQARVSNVIATPDQFPTSIAFMPDDSRLLIGFGDGKISMVDGIAGEILQPTNISLGESVRSLAVSPDGQQIVVATREEISLWDLETRKPILTLSHGPKPTSLDWSSDGKRIAAGFSDGTVEIWTLPISP